MGLLVAIEGIDGSGKGTQARHLVDRLRQENFKTELFSFPRYSETRFGAAIGTFLNGGFGPLENVHPQLAAVLYAGDRHESRGLLQASLQACDVVVCDRYVSSNLAHQGARLEEPARGELIEWIEAVEHEAFDLPHPDRVIWLDVPVDLAGTLIAKKTPRDYTDKQADLQESDREYQQLVRDVYQDLAAERPGWQRIACVVGGAVRPVEDIADDVWNVVAERLSGSET